MSNLYIAQPGGTSPVPWPQVAPHIAKISRILFKQITYGMDLLFVYIKDRTILHLNLKKNPRRQKTLDSCWKKCPFGAHTLSQF